MKTKAERILEIESNIKAYEDMLKIMPDDTVLGRLCIRSLLKSEEKKLANLMSEK